MAEFRTAKSQHILPIDVAVKGTVVEGTKVTSANRKAAICYGDFIVLHPANGNVPAYITKATKAEVAAKTATHIMALTDQVFGHFNTEVADYTRSVLVGATVTGTVGAASPVKRVGLYPIFDWNDIIADVDENDVAAS